MNFEQARFNMIEQQIRPWDVLDADVLQLLAVIKREDFVPLAHKVLAFADMEIPLGHGQSMLPPRVEARMLQDAVVQKTDNVLEIGSGSGYMAALLANQAHRVISLEINPDLAKMARENLQKAGITNAEVRQFDGSKGASAESPFDVIVLSGSVAEVPQALLAQLKVGGRLVAIVGDEPVMRATVVTRTSDTDFTTTQPWDTVAQRLQNFPEPERFTF
ncbi:protein-L-isoaspartate O-methyltransferase [Rhodoferax sp. PAMC 29310]|uniref:protein-L-isoaspartate O-methyltransferase family protein n=1 Tax=Rhodoferax sp. PAMC 29310 TaxID=2822760 RepID=UPI001B34383D|nr:protein-L-isoaspartate O-methyltransferase [Rhodoferax sp. PAMC 29310]